ncbi:MAG: hypothetical protein QGH15_04205 [Kiritimatiellia bacterium]|nr:hypothetical protein [Kiritimatiellia bacterium]
MSGPSYFVVPQVGYVSVRVRQTNPRKMYPLDQGLIPAFDRSGRLNTGHAL